MKRRYQIAVIGDSNIAETSNKAQLAKKLGNALIDNGYRIVTGGLGGIMRAVADGAKSSKKYQDGDVISILPGFNPDEFFNNGDIRLATGLDLARNIIIANSDAVIAIGGGAGTLSEMAYAWALKRLIIAYKTDGWSGKLAGKRIDRRTRYSDIKDDRIYGVKSESEVIRLLQSKISSYNKHHRGIAVRKEKGKRG